MKSTTNYNEPKLNSLLDLYQRFPDEQSCLDFIEQQRWNGKPQCPRCQSEKVSKFTTGKKAGRLWYCKGCRKQFTVKIGTIFEDSAMPLQKWFMAIWLCTAHKKGIASAQLARDIGVTQKSAWHMLHRIRYMMSFGMMNKKMKGTIEADETYVGGKPRKHSGEKLKRGRGSQNKTPVFGVVERDGDVVAYPVEKVDKVTLQGDLRDRVAKGSTINTDEWGAYEGLDDEYNHETVNHNFQEYARGHSHVNSIENFWSMLKRGITGIYHQVSPKHLHRYCGEFAYRMNTRKSKDGDRFGHVFGQAEGRLTYDDLTGKTNAQGQVQAS
jgi:transposase-like protein